MRFESGEASTADAFNAFIAAVPGCVEKERMLRGTYGQRSENTLADFNYALDRLGDGVLGKLEETQLAQFTALAQTSFPLATRFSPTSAKSGKTESEAKHVPNGNAEQ